MKKTNVLMIDDNIELVKMVKEYFKDNKEIEVTLTANDGIEGLNLIENDQDEYNLDEIAVNWFDNYNNKED